MGKELSSEYYDSVYKTSKEYNKDYKQSVYFPLWQELEKLLVPNIPIIDIGCGVGQTAKFLIGKGFTYCGIDFSKEAIRKAKIENPTGGFLEGDLFSFNYKHILSKDEEVQFLISETLEHIEKDLELLDKLKTERPKCNVIISVPMFDSAGHVRFFKNENDVFERYCKSFKVYNLKTFQKFVIIQGKL